jgi:hypothetical protein
MVAATRQLVVESYNDIVTACNDPRNKTYVSVRAGQMQVFVDCRP